MEWQPIDTAPKDGTVIDVWCAQPDDSVKEGAAPIRIRLPDVAWHNGDEIFPYIGWVYMMPDGNWDLVDGPPVCEFGLPRWIPTHWMPLPEPPNK